MITPLSFIEDAKSTDCWHICDASGKTICGASCGSAEWNLPDEPFVQVNLCMDCWEQLATKTGIAQAYQKYLDDEVYQ